MEEMVGEVNGGKGSGEEDKEGRNEINESGGGWGA